MTTRRNRRAATGLLTSIQLLILFLPRRPLGAVTHAPFFLLLVLKNIINVFHARARALCLSASRLEDELVQNRLSTSLGSLPFASTTLLEHLSALIFNLNSFARRSKIVDVGNGKDFLLNQCRHWREKRSLRKVHQGAFVFATLRFFNHQYQSNQRSAQRKPSMI